MRQLIKVGFVLSILLSTPFAIAATLITDLKCTSGTIPKFISGSWVCRPDRTERMLVDAKGKQLGAVIDVQSNGAQVIRTFTDVTGKKRLVRLLAGPQGFGFWTTLKGGGLPPLTTNAEFSGFDCTGDLLMLPDYGDGPQFKSLGELGYPLTRNSLIPQTQDLYLPVSGVPEMSPVSSAWVYELSTSSWRCANYGVAGDRMMIRYELAIPDMNSGVSFPLDVKIVQ